MPLYSDHNYYYGSSLPPPYYLATSPYMSRISPYSYPYISPVSALLSTGANPMPRNVRSYTPKLSSISESVSPLTQRRDIIKHQRSPRDLVAKTYYRQPRPTIIYTDSIDVSSKRRGDNENDESSPGVITRGRTTVRMQTRKPKENPGLKKKKTQAEMLMEKYLIKEKPIKEENSPKRKRIWEDKDQETGPAQSGAIKRTNTVKTINPMLEPNTQVQLERRANRRVSFDDEALPFSQRKCSIDSELLKEEAALFDNMIQEELGPCNKKEMIVESNVNNVRITDPRLHESKRSVLPYIRKNTSSNSKLDDTITLKSKRKTFHQSKNKSKELPLDQDQTNKKSVVGDSNQDELSARLTKRSIKKKKHVCGALKFKIDSLHVEEKSSPKLLQKFKYEVVVEENSSGSTASMTKTPNSYDNIPKCISGEHSRSINGISTDIAQNKMINDTVILNKVCDRKCDRLAMGSDHTTENVKVIENSSDRFLDNHNSKRVVEPGFGKEEGLVSIFNQDKTKPVVKRCLQRQIQIISHNEGTLSYPDDLKNLKTVDVSLNPARQISVPCTSEQDSDVNKSQDVVGPKLSNIEPVNYNFNIGSNTDITQQNIVQSDVKHNTDPHNVCVLNKKELKKVRCLSKIEDQEKCTSLHNIDKHEFKDNSKNNLESDVNINCSITRVSQTLENVESHLAKITDQTKKSKNKINDNKETHEMLPIKSGIKTNIVKKVLNSCALPQEKTQYLDVLSKNKVLSGTKEKNDLSSTNLEIHNNVVIRERKDMSKGAKDSVGADFNKIKGQTISEPVNSLVEENKAKDEITLIHPAKQNGKEPPISDITKQESTNTHDCLKTPNKAKIELSSPQTVLPLFGSDKESKDLFSDQTVTMLLNITNNDLKDNKETKNKIIKSESAGADEFQSKSDKRDEQSTDNFDVKKTKKKSKSLDGCNYEKGFKKKMKREGSKGHSKKSHSKSPGKSKLSPTDGQDSESQPLGRKPNNETSNENSCNAPPEKVSELSKQSTHLMHFINKCLRLSADNESISVEMSDEDISSTCDCECSDTSSDSSSECDVNCHRKCEKLMPHLCGVNQKVIVEALTSLRKGSSESRDHGSPSHHQSNSALILEGEPAHHYPGRVSPPATTIPKFRKYTMDDFQFLKVLGKGSFGKVLLAELRGTEYYYAVKCLKKDVVLEDDDVECTLIERKVLALGTNHPYLCHLFCTFQTDSHLFFVMEYLNGGDLMFHIQQQGRFDEGRARFYAAEIVSGLKFLHKKGIVYRDLKLDNILLDFDGHVRIADFGMCKLQIYLDRTADTFCGTPDYMAPEILKGLKYNQCVDWWSFGILLYEMLVGQSPFSGCDEDDLFWCICNRQPHYPRFITLEAKRILVELLEKDASKRLGSCENGATAVMGHVFFNGLDWDRLEQRGLQPPFKPNVRHPLDVHYFDKHFTVERACLTPIDPTILRSMDQTQFQGFSYTNPNVTD